MDDAINAPDDDAPQNADESFIQVSKPQNDDNDADEEQAALAHKEAEVDKFMDDAINAPDTGSEDSFIQVASEDADSDDVSDAEEARMEAENDKFMDNALNGPDGGDSNGESFLQ